MKRFFLILLFIFALAVPVSALDGDNVVIVIDAGHGGMDGGTDKGKLSEKEYNLSFALLLKEKLEQDGRFTVILTRDDDTYMKFLPRALVGLEAEADLFISLHCNSNGSSSVRGCEAYISVVDEFSAYDLADSILKRIEKASGIPYGKIEAVEDTGDSLGIYYWNPEKQWDMPGASHLGKKSDYYSINTWCSKFGIPSIIVEHGYLSNSSDSAAIHKEATRESIAEAEASALIDYFFGHEHEYSDTRLCDRPESCTLGGAYSYRCKICNVRLWTYKTDPDPDAHYWRQTASKKATCTSDGYIERVCQIAYNLNDKGYACEVHTYTEEIKATGHDYVILSDTEAGHGYDGLFHKKCSLCGDEVKEIRYGEEHTYTVTEEIAPTCVEDGRLSRKCSVCGNEIVEVIPCMGHDYKEISRVEPDGMNDGSVLYRCAVCEDEKEELLSHCPHSFPVENQEKLEPTCGVEGYYRETCSKCGWVNEEIYPALTHSYVTQMSASPSCENEGYIREKCSICGEVRTESIPRKDHAYVYNEENHESVCKYCGKQGEVTEIHEKSPETFLKSPLFVGIVVFVAAQAAISVFIVLRNRNHVKKKRKVDDFDYSDESDV